MFDIIRNNIKIVTGEEALKKMQTDKKYQGWPQVKIKNVIIISVILFIICYIIGSV